jgi:hypothetical protein
MEWRGMTDRYQMCGNAASRLQREAYAKQVKGRSAPLRHFSPCAKGLVYTAEMGAGNPRPQSLVTQEAARTLCDCHPGLSESDLIGYELPHEEKQDAHQ